MPPSHYRLTELAAVFLKLGTIVISAICWLLIWRWRINPIWLI